MENKALVFTSGAKMKEMICIQFLTTKNVSHIYGFCVPCQSGKQPIANVGKGETVTKLGRQHFRPVTFNTGQSDQQN